jgi:hypothetical protein
MSLQTTKVGVAEGSQSGARKIRCVPRVWLGLAKLFAARGGNVVATERGSSAGLQAAAAKANGRVRIEHVDITNHYTIKELRRRSSGELFDVIFIVVACTMTRRICAADLCPVNRTIQLTPAITWLRLHGLGSICLRPKCRRAARI